MEKIIILQNRIKFLLYILKKINNNVKKANLLIYNISKVILSNYSKDILNQFVYNKNLSKLDDISVILESIPKKVHLKDLTFKYIIKLNKCFKILLEVSKECGINKFSLLLELQNLEIENTELVDFLDNTFNITDSNIFVESKIKSNTNKLTIYKNNEKNNILNYDLSNVSKLDKVMFVKQLKKNLSFTENVFGCRIYLRCNKNNVLIVNGYFNNDPINIFRKCSMFQKKEEKLNEELKNLNISLLFKKSYLKQLTLRDFLINEESVLVEQVKNDYFLILNYKNKSLSTLVKDFLNKTCYEQVKFITLFIMFEDDSEIQNMAYLLYDMITNESYLLKPASDGHYIFNSLHWNLQKSFKVINKKMNDELKKISNFNFENISYEKKIFMMKVPDNVKQKAMDKLKEISNKSNDNCSKATQYLDNMLKIPFGIYQKEEILSAIDKLKGEFLLNLKNLSDLKIDSNINDICLNILNKKKFYYDEMVFMIRKLTNYNNMITGNIFDNKLFIMKVVNNYVKNKNILIEEYIVEINKDLHQKYKEKGTKKYYVGILNKFFADKSIDINIRKKHFSTINDTSSISSIKKKNDKLGNCISKLNKNLNDYNCNVSKYLQESSKILDNAIYGQDEAKNEIKRIISQWINGDMTGYCLGFEGPPGTGKTTIAKQGIAECLKDYDGESRPFSFIALGGSSNGSTLEGHNYTYLGSTHGKIVDILIESKCMNPIIYIDELDKISNTENGKELIGILTHLTDSSQNEHFNDKYFAGIDFDLSKVLFIFSYNDYNKLDKILADRIHRIKFNYMSTNDKVIIMKDYLIPKLLNEVGLKEMIQFEDSIVKYIIYNYTMEGGVRKLKERIFEIIRQVNMNLLSDNNYLNKIDAKGLLKDEKIVLDTNMVDEIFEKKIKLLQQTIDLNDKVGLVNGLYATSAGTGGITLIEALKTYHETKLSLVITGQQGDVMKESIICAKTIAWNILPDKVQNELNAKLKENSFGIHIHCPEAATPKDGPSAGTAITIAILSLLSNLKVKNNVALTGEIDLNGKVHAVGGIDLKIEGGKNAGVNTILLPKENEQDFNIIIKSKPELKEDLNIIFVSNVWEVINYVFVENDFEFIKYTN